MLGTDYSLQAAALLWFILAGLVSVVAVLAASSPAVYLAFFLGLTAFMLGVHLVSEVAENLVNPVAELTLAHQPVTAATWSAAEAQPSGQGGRLPRRGHERRAGGRRRPSRPPELGPHRSPTPPCTCWPRWVSVWSWPCSAAASSAGSCASSPSDVSRRSRQWRRPLPLVAFWIYNFTRNPPGQEPAAGATSLEMPAALRTAVEAMPGGLRGFSRGGGGDRRGRRGRVRPPGAVERPPAAARRLDAFPASARPGGGGGGCRGRVPGWPDSPAVRRPAPGTSTRAPCSLRDWQFLRNTGMNAAGILAAVVVVPIVGREVSPFRPGDDFRPGAHAAPRARPGHAHRLPLPGVRQRPQGRLDVLGRARVLPAPVRGRGPCSALAPADRRAARGLAALLRLVLELAGCRRVRRVQRRQRLPLPGRGPAADRRASLRAGRRPARARACRSVWESRS